MRLSLELAGAFVPMGDEQLAAPALTLSPGLDGVAVRRGDRVLATFPGQLLRRNSDASRAIFALIGAIAGDASTALEPIATLKERGYIFYRFRTSHVAEPSAGAGGVFLHRGGRVVERSELTLASLREFADALGERLMRTSWPGVEPLGMLGEYDPVSGRQLVRLAPPVDQAICALALVEYSTAPGLDPERKAMARRRALAILEDLAVVQEREADPGQSIVASAACIVALAKYAELEPPAIHENARVRSLLEHWKTVEQAWIPGEGFAEGIPPSAYGLLALAAVRAQRLGVAGEGADPGAWVLAAYRATPAELLVSQMPWLGWASVELAAMNQEPIAAADALRQMRDLVWEHQLRLADLDSDSRDLAGGIVFTRGSTPLPTWQGARPLAFIATMLGRESLTPGDASSGEVPAELARLLDSLRFLRQLSAGPSEGHMYADPERAAWGVRKALWDQRMDPASTALVLLALCETLESLDQIAGRPGED